MKKLIKNYTFDAGSNKVILNDYSIIRLDSVLVITDVVTNSIIYNFADPNTGGSVNGNEFIFKNDVTGRAGHSLQIFYDDDSNLASDETLETLVAITKNSDNSIALLKRIAKLLEPIGTQDSAQRQRVAVETIANMSTLTTLTTLNQVAGIDYRWLVIDEARNAYANGIRRNIQ